MNLYVKAQVISHQRCLAKVKQGTECINRHLNNNSEPSIPVKSIISQRPKDHGEIFVWWIVVHYTAVQVFGFLTENPYNFG